MNYIDEQSFTINVQLKNNFVKFKYYVYECKFREDRLHFHSSRHTFASWLVQDGVSFLRGEGITWALGRKNYSGIFSPTA